MTNNPYTKIRLLAQKRN